MLALLQAFPGGRTVVLMDNFEYLVAPETWRSVIVHWMRHCGRY